MARYRYRTPSSDARQASMLTVRNREALIATHGLEKALKISKEKHATACVLQMREEAVMWRMICDDIERDLRAQEREGM